MQDVVVASQDGTGGPYLIVPKEYADEVVEFVSKHKLPCSAPREANKYDVLFEMADPPKRVEPAILDWLKSRKWEVERLYRGETNDPISIYWGFLPD